MCWKSNTRLRVHPLTWKESDIPQLYTLCYKDPQSRICKTRKPLSSSYWSMENFGLNFLHPVHPLVSLPWFSWFVTQLDKKLTIWVFYWILITNMSVFFLTLSCNNSNILVMIEKSINTLFWVFIKENLFQFLNDLGNLFPYEVKTGLNICYKLDKMFMF